MEQDKKKRPISVAGMIKRLSLASEESIEFLTSVLQDETADLKDRINCAKYIVSQHATLVAQAEKEQMNRTTQALNNYRLRKEALEDASRNGQETLVTGDYKGITNISMDIILPQ